MKSPQITSRCLQYSVFFAAYLASTWVNAIPITWGVNGNQYEFISSSNITWTDARGAALSLGSGWDLASVTSMAERDFIITLLPATPFSREHVWLGGSDANTEGSFEWSNGDAFTYSSWWSGEPNNLGNEDYLAFDWRNGWNWNDVPNSGVGLITGYIVENSNVPVPEPVTFVLISIGLVGIGYKRLLQNQGQTRIKNMRT